MAMLDRVMSARAAPKFLFVNGGSEFSKRSITERIITTFGSISAVPASRPTRTAASFNGSLREE